MTFGSLFAGIGGMDLGLERAGMACRWQVEINPFCRKVLAKHWPDVPKHDDVRTFPDGNTERWRVDLIAGGFPCQDVSNAGRRLGLDGARSGLWSEFARCIRVLRPRFVLVENTPGLLSRGFGRVLGDLAACGYDAEWDCLPAAAFGANHIRDRVFVLAYSASERPTVRGVRPALSQGGVGRGDVGTGGDSHPWQEPIRWAGKDSSVLPDTQSRWARQLRWQQCPPDGQTQWHLYWATGKPPLPRVEDGIPDRVDRNTALGNAVVPQIAEWIGRRIIEAANREATS